MNDMHYNPARPDSYSGTGFPDKPFPCGITVGTYIGGADLLNMWEHVTCEECRREAFKDTFGLCDDDLKWPPEYLAAFNGQG